MAEEDEERVCECDAERRGLSRGRGLEEARAGERRGGVVDSVAGLELSMECLVLSVGASMLPVPCVWSVCPDTGSLAVREARGADLGGAVFCLAGTPRWPTSSILYLSMLLLGSSANIGGV
jgi:hypothetical protein